MKISALAAILIVIASMLAPAVSAQAPKLVIPKLSSLDNPAPPSSKKDEIAKRRQLLRQRAQLRRQRQNERRAKQEAAAAATAAATSATSADAKNQKDLKAPVTSNPAPVTSPVTAAKPAAVTENTVQNTRSVTTQDEKKPEKQENNAAIEQKVETPAVALKTEEVKPPAPKPETPLKLDTLKENEPGGYSISTLLFRTFGALLLIVGLIAASGWGLRKFGFARQKGKGEEAHSLTVVNTVALGDKKTLQVVRFGERTLLIGSTSQGITLLAEEGYDSEDGPDYVAEYSDEQEPAGYFEGELSRASLLTSGFNGRRN